jgi:hypothetical protein
MRVISKERGSFLKKRTKKLLPIAYRCRRVRDSQSKVFCFFSSEKKILFFWSGGREPPGSRRKSTMV